MGQPRSIQAPLSFRLGPHWLRLLLAHSHLEVHLECQSTADQWGASFQAAAIEEMTRKTGNFKQFGIFCSMLEAALLQSSDAVSLELLTSKELEVLGSREAGMAAGARSCREARSPLRAKRFLILVYSVEFDRILYPLPLPPLGRSGPVGLRRRLPELRREPERLRARPRPDPRDAEIQRLRQHLQGALQEKRRCQDELRRRTRELQAQLDAAQASEQRLQVRLRSLSAALASTRRGHGTPPPPGSRERPRPSRSPSPAGPPCFDPKAQQRRQQQLQPHNRSRGAGSDGGSPARSRGRSSSAGSSRSRRSDPPPPPRRGPHGRRPPSALACNGARAGQRPTPCQAPPPRRPGKEPQHETELAEIDARLQALQELMARMLPPGSQWEPPGAHT